MKKLFVCSDIHGFFSEWMKALSIAGFDKNNPDHILVHCGDLLDRGKQANKCLRFVNDLPEDRKILIRGNHELLMDDILYKKRYFERHDYSNGTVNTIEQLTGISQVYDGIRNGQAVQQAMIDEMRNLESWKKYYSAQTMCAEVGPYIFVHGWIPPKYDKKLMSVYDSDWREMPYWIWKDATWLNGMAMWNKGIREPNKTIVCGHWHTSWGHSRLHEHGVEWDDAWAPDNGLDHNTYFDPFEDDGILALDSCVAYSGQINVKVLEVSDGDWGNRKFY